MRIAVLADIHGNLAALEAVIQDLQLHSPDLVVNLGDHVSGPLWAADTAHLLMSRSEWIQINGNHDRHLLQLPPREMGASDYAANEQLSAKHRLWLESLPFYRVIADDILLCHGTPASDSEYLAEDVACGFARLAAPADIRERLGAARGAVLCGHSHVPRFVQLDDGALVINPGSVGLQAYEDAKHRLPHVIEMGSPHARYALLDRADHRWRATLRVVDYDWELAAKAAECNQRPDWAHALRTGYARL
jgi:putative phosphoesterase